MDRALLDVLRDAHGVGDDVGDGASDGADNEAGGGGEVVRAGAEAQEPDPLELVEGGVLHGGHHAAPDVATPALI